MNDVVVDLSIMVENPKCAIKCFGKDEVLIIGKALVEQFPTAIPENFDFERAWDYACSDLGRYTDGSVCFDLYQGTIEDKLMGYCYEQWYLDRGYKLVELSQLMNVEEISESDADINSLFS